MTPPEPTTFGAALLAPLARARGLTLVPHDPFLQAGTIRRPGRGDLHFCGTHLSLNSDGVAETCRRKDLAARILRAAGLAVPDDLFLPADAPFPAQRPDWAMAWPLVLKPNRGQGGAGVTLVADAQAVARHRAAHGGAMLLQPHLLGRDIRIMGLDDRVIGAFARHGAGLARNLAQGARAEIITPPAGAADLARAALRALGLRYGGVDLIETAAGPVVLEVNPAPGYVKLHRQGGAAAELARAMAQAVLEAP